MSASNAVETQKTQGISYTQSISSGSQGGKGERAMSIDDYVIGARIPMPTQLQLER